METLPISLVQLQGMIGMGLRWRNVNYAVVEVLEDGPALVVQSLAPGTDRKSVV